MLGKGTPMSEHITANSTVEFLKILKDREVQFVDFNFTDFRGKWQHTAQHIDTVDKDLIEGGVMFDGSSIAGGKAINESDMILKPDVKKICVDPFAAQSTVKIFCDVIEPSTGKPY